MIYVYGFGIIAIATAAIIVGMSQLIAYADEPSPLLFEGFDIIVLVVMSTIYVAILMLCSTAMFYIG